MKLSSLRRPFVCLVVSEADPKACAKVIDAYEKEVDAFEINLSPLDQRSFGDVISSTRRPCIVTNRRSEFMKLYGYPNLPAIREEERARRLKMAVGVGASAVDCELDIFDEAMQKSKPAYASQEEEVYASKSGSGPAEFSRDRQAVLKQREFVRDAKQIGAEVVFSCHAQTVIRKAQATAIISAMSARGADFGKVVSLTLGKRDLVPFIESVLLLQRVSKIPFNLMNVGSEPVLGRLLSVSLGSSWVYCRPDRGATYLGQPTVGQVRAFFGIINPPKKQ